MGKFFKDAGFNAETASKIGKEYILPSLMIGPVVGAGVTAATSKNMDDFKRHAGKGIVAGVVGDAATGAAMGLWNNRKELKL